VERRVFFTLHPNASLLGKMFCDARLAIDAATELLKTPRPIYLYGFAMGGTVALLTAGLDERIDGVATVAGFTPLRTDTADRRTGGLARLSHLYAWLPRLGAFIGHEDRVPIDYNEILASIAPRKVLVVAPTEDRYAALGEVRDTVEFARMTYKSFGDEHGIEMVTPFEENRLTDEMHQQVIDWLARQPRTSPSKASEE
jgi:pimeloyl-ACP methyl ester carboxylesterase